MDKLCLVFVKIQKFHNFNVCSHNVSEEICLVDCKFKGEHYVFISLYLREVIVKSTQVLLLYSVWIKL